MLTVEQAELDFKELQTKKMNLQQQQSYDKNEMNRIQCRMAYLKKKFGFEEKIKKEKEKQLYKQVSSNIHLSIKTRLQQLEEKANKLLQEAKTEEERKSIKERLYYARLRATYSQQ
jgi:hypothetical protein